MTRPSGNVLAFPIDRRIALVRYSAAELLALNGEAANNYWHAKAKSLLQELIDQGRTMDEARGEVLRFFEAVQEEFRAQQAQQRSMISA